MSDLPLPSPRDVVAATLGSGAAAVRGVAFWTAATLPLVYVPLAVVWPARFLTLWPFVAFFAVDLLALVVGHRHGG